jgi:hypothetical protein
MGPIAPAFCWAGRRSRAEIVEAAECEQEASSGIRIRPAAFPGELARDHQWEIQVALAPVDLQLDWSDTIDLARSVG